MLGSAVTARSNVNVALVKYWGKRDPALNLPATGSISLTLDGLSVEARGRLRRRRSADDADDRRRAGERRRARAPRATSSTSCAREAGRRERARVVDPQPRAARRGPGVVGGRVRRARAGRRAGRPACGSTPPALSALARRGSGSAARSIFGGFVEWHRGERADGSDSVAEPLLAPADWDLRVVVADHAARPEGGVVARRHGARRRVAALPGVGRRRRGRSRGGPRGDPGARPRGARPARRAQRAQDARRRPGGAAAAALLARRDGRVRAPRLGAARRRHARLRHHRRGPAGEGALRSRPTPPRIARRAGATCRASSACSRARPAAAPRCSA